MFSTEYYGQALTIQKVVPGNTATSLSSEFYKYTERTLAYTSGGTTEIVAGNWIVGASSSAKAEVVSVTLTTGTWAGGDAAGTFRIRCQHGTFQSENLNVGASSNLATIAANSSIVTTGYQEETPYEKPARFAWVHVYANTALCSFNGATPDQTSLVGMPIESQESIFLSNYEDIKNFKCIDYASGSASNVFVMFYF